MRFILLFCLAFCVLPFYGFAQWLPGGVSTTNDQVRTGVTGIGFLTPVAASTAANGRTRFLVNGTGNDGGILAHFVSGGVGNFSDKWCGLGIGNPTGTPSPYGLAIADTNSVGFYNLLRENFNGAIRKNTIAGFGISGGENTNRFIVRGYSGTGAAAGKDLLVANPNGSVGINAEPLASFWVDANETTAATTFKAMAITGATEVNPSAIKISSSSGMGSQGNTSLTNNDIAVEGSRSQIPDFVTSITNLVAGTQEGVAVNMQVVRDLNPAVVVPPVDIAPVMRAPAESTR